MQAPQAQNPQKQGAFSVELDRIRAAAGPIVSAHGAELVDVELKTEQGGWVLRIIVEKAGSAEKKATTQEAALDLEVCADISRELSPALDVIDAIPQRYSLEVGSPGLERDLRSAADYARFSGQKAKLRLTVPQRGQSVLVGILQGIVTGPTDVLVQVQDGGASYEVPLSTISAARLVFELTPAPKPGAPQKKKKK